MMCFVFFFLQAEDGIRDLVRSRGLGDVYKRQAWEGARRMKQAEEGLARLRDKVDTLIAIPNSRLIEICPPDATIEMAFETADDVLRQALVVSEDAELFKESASAAPQPVIFPAGDAAPDEISRH